MREKKIYIYIKEAAGGYPFNPAFTMGDFSKDRSPLCLICPNILCVKIKLADLKISNSHLSQKCCTYAACIFILNFHMNFFFFEGGMDLYTTVVEIKVRK